MPATSGHPDFERVFRVQMNTLEWMPIFLPSLWLFAIYISDLYAAVLGLIWIAGRVLYLTGYSQAAAKRGRGLCSSGACRRHALGRRAGRDRVADRSGVRAHRLTSSCEREDPYAAAYQVKPHADACA